MLADHLRRISNSRHTFGFALTIGTALFVLVVAADYLTSYELSLSAFYLLVVLALSWFCGMWWGTLFAFLSIFSQIEIGRIAGNRFSEPFYFYVSHGNKLFSFLLVAILFSIVRTMFDREQSTARIDYLTGLTNRMGFFERVAIEIARHRRDRKPFAVAYLDCDHFKEVNDGLGHAEGDRILQAVAQTLKSHLRATDIVARLGGDEFALVLPDSDEFGALQIITKVRQELDLAMTRNEWPTTFSIGVGIFASVPPDVDRVIAFADTLMYRVKATGKNKVLHRRYDPDAAETNPPGRLTAG